MAYEILSLLGISFVGTLFWVLSPEATAALYGAQDRLNPMLIGLICASGQAMMLSVLYFAGASLCEKWTWLKSRVVGAQKRFGEKLEHHFLLLSFPAGVFGIPPVLAMATLANGFRVKLIPFILVAAGGRFVRFYVLASGGEQATSFFSAMPQLIYRSICAALLTT